MRNPCILIPSYNEDRTIGKIVRDLVARKFRVYVVDDGSTDATARAAGSEGAVVIKNERNMGKGAALKAGFGMILGDGGFDSVIIMDGDDQHDVADIAHIIRKARESGADMVLGNRMEDTSGMPMTRVVTNRFMSWLLSTMTGQRIPDTQCGFRLVRTELLRKLNLRSSNYDIDSEMLLEAARAGGRIASVPVRTVYNESRSRINPFKDTLRFIRLLLNNTTR